MITISLCMIVKNEEKVLSRCLDSVNNLVDEIIIIDTGSTDNTKEIAKKYTSNVYDFKWCNDFSKARNYSFSKAHCDYILWLDADDVILDKDKEKLINLKSTLTKDVDFVMLKYNVGFDEYGNVTFSYFRERLIKRSLNAQWKSPIHETITPFGKIKYLDICITHKKENYSYSTRNLDIFNDMISKGITLDSRQKYYYARELMYNGKYLDAIDKLNSFLLDDNGWIENKINACMDLATCYLNLNDDTNYLSSLFLSFTLDKPRGEFCSQIGIYFMKKAKYDIAIYWFKEALKSKPNIKSGAFVQQDYYTYIPCINLCVCYDKIGKRKLAINYNDKAGKYKPQSKEYLNNLKYFKENN